MGPFVWAGFWHLFGAVTLLMAGNCHSNVHEDLRSEVDLYDFSEHKHDYSWLYVRQVWYCEQGICCSC